MAFWLAAASAVSLTPSHAFVSTNSSPAERLFPALGVSPHPTDAAGNSQRTELVERAESMNKER